MFLNRPRKAPYHDNRDRTANLPSPVYQQFCKLVLGIDLSAPSADELRAREERKQLEWLAKISVRHEQELNRLLSEERRAAEDRALDEWVAQITEPEWGQRRDGRPSADGRMFRDAGTDPDPGWLCEREWNAAKHPRRGGPPNAGWFASTGGSGGNGGGLSNVAAERLGTKIKGARGKNWSGGRVLDLVRAVAPGWRSFVEQHMTINRIASGGQPSTSVRIGENGPDVRTVPGSINDAVKKTVHFEIPEDWSDAEVARYILKQLADHNDAYHVASQWAIDKPALFGELRSERFRNGLDTIAKFASGYYSALAGLAPGGGAAVAVWDIGQGDHLGVALGAVFMLPLGKMAKSGIESGGTLAIRAGEKLVALLPVRAIERARKLAPAQLKELEKRLEGAKTGEQISAIIQTFVGVVDRHHPLPKFLAGEPNQALVRLPTSVHQEFHKELGKELKTAGFTLPIGSAKGSAKEWAEHFANNKDSQAKAFDAVLKASATIDKKYGTKITGAVVDNLTGGSFTALK